MPLLALRAHEWEISSCYKNPQTIMAIRPIGYNRRHSM
jgi:hypothetical protein